MTTPTLRPGYYVIDSKGDIGVVESITVGGYAQVRFDPKGGLCDALWLGCRYATKTEIDAAGIVPGQVWTGLTS